MITVAQAMVRCLEEEKISVVFGYPGAAICPFYDALSNSSIRHVLVRQEQNAGHAANGYARITGKPAVCVATSGPGALNLITAIATAYMDSIPMVIITGQVSSEQLGSDAFQEADITGAAEPFTKYSYIVKDPNQIARVFKEAFYLAGTGRPGPVLIDIPMDVQNVKVRFQYPKEIQMRSYKPNVNGHPGQVKRALTAIKNAHKPLICAGGGIFVSNAQKEFLDFAKASCIPVVSTMMGIGALPGEDPMYFGMLGMHGVKEANIALHEADLLILLGARAADRAVRSPKKVNESTKVIHIDIDPAEIGKNLDADIPIVGDLKNVLGEMAAKVASHEGSEWTQYLCEIRDERKLKEKYYEGYLNPKAFIRLLSQKASERAVLVADVGQNQIWAANHFKVKNGRFLTSGGMGTMGYSIPAAVGAKLAGASEVISICGDGSFQMQMMELGTIKQNEIPVKMIVMTNNRLGMVRELQTNFYAGNETAVFLDGSPDIAALAGTYGICSRKIHSMEEASGAIDELLKADGPYLLECMVSPDESTL